MADRSRSDRPSFRRCLSGQFGNPLSEFCIVAPLISPPNFSRRDSEKCAGSVDKAPGVKGPVWTTSRASLPVLATIEACMKIRHRHARGLRSIKPLQPVRRRGLIAPRRQSAPGRGTNMLKPRNRPRQPVSVGWWKRLPFQSKSRPSLSFRRKAKVCPNRCRPVCTSPNRCAPWTNLSEPVRTRSNLGVPR